MDPFRSLPLIGCRPLIGCNGMPLSVIGVMASTQECEETGPECSDVFSKGI